MRFFALLCFLWVLPTISIGQVIVTTSQILSTARKQPQFQLQHRKIDFLKKTPHELPLINRWEFRTQTHDLDLAEQRFAFRIRPNSRKERLSQRQLHFSTIQFHQEATRKVLLKGIQQRYNTCLTLLLATKRKQLMMDLETVYQALSKIYENNGLLDEMIDAEEAYEAISLELFDYEQEIGRAVRKTRYFLSDDNDFEIIPDDFLSINDLKKRMVTINPNEPIINPTLGVLENEINLVEKELLIEDAKQQKWFNFAQVRYGGSDSFNPFRETFNIAFAFNLPTKGNNILKTNKLELAKIAAENDWGEANYFLEKERKNSLRDLSNWLEKYESLTKNLIAVQDKMTQSFSVKNNADYELLSLKIRRHVLRKNLRLHQVEEKIYQAYLDWLGVTGKMIQLPLVNYLTPDFQPF